MLIVFFLLPAQGKERPCHMFIELLQKKLYTLMESQPVILSYGKDNGFWKRDSMIYNQRDQVTLSPGPLELEPEVSKKRRTSTKLAMGERYLSNLKSNFSKHEALCQRFSW